MSNSRQNPPHDLPLSDQNSSALEMAPASAEKNLFFPQIRKINRVYNDSLFYGFGKRRKKNKSTYLNNPTAHHRDFSQRGTLAAPDGYTPSSSLSYYAQKAAVHRSRHSHSLINAWQK